MWIEAQGLDFSALNAQVRAAGQECRVRGCLGQRFLGAGLSAGHITVSGVPGNALGAYLSGAEIIVEGNAQDAVGDTMNSGRIVIYGNVGDVAGYAMRGGSIYVRGNAGYRAGIHMKEYREKKPVLVIGGRAGSFLGEYQAGGIIAVLGLHTDGKPIVGNFPCTGMHGGKLILRGRYDGFCVPGTNACVMPGIQIEELLPLAECFCGLFGYDADGILRDDFTVITPDSRNPYQQMYVAN